MISFANFKVLYKILTLVTLLLFLTGAVGFIGYNATSQVNAKSDDQDVSAKELDRAHEVLERTMEISLALREIAHDPKQEIISKHRKEQENVKDFYEKEAAFLRTSADEKQLAMLQTVEASFRNYLAITDKFLTAAGRVGAMPTEEDIYRLNTMMEESIPANRELRRLLVEYIDYASAQSAQAAEEATQTFDSSSRDLILASLGAVALGVILGCFIAIKGIARPLGDAVGNLNALIQDDLSVEIKNADRKDEVGAVAQAAQTFKEVLIKNKAMAEAEKLEVEKKLQRQQRMAELIATFDGTATQTVATVASASTQLSQTAENMSEVASNTNQQSIEVASASEQASHNVQSVASAAEEMAATVQEISRQISMSNDIVRQAMLKAEEADNSSRELVDMSKSVGTIATLIEDIAGQINLLALNATIESARSGEAGKGFAVVANEVKNLATQTAKATEQIRQQLDAVQKTAVSVADMLGGVRESISEVSQSSAAIAAAVEEQSAATHEIVSNMNTATQGVEQINSGIFAIKGGTDSTTAATREVLDAAKVLSIQAERMDTEVKSFLSNIQSA